MTPATLPHEINKAIPQLLDLARELTLNKISDHCKFILTEIKNSEENLHIQRWQNKIENDKKTPGELRPVVQQLVDMYHDIHDINLEIYLSTEELTIIDVRYYSRLSIEPEYREKIKDNPPMLHCKVATPYWLTDKNEKFDINWPHEDEWKLGKKEPEYVASLVDDDTKEMLASGYRRRKMMYYYFFGIAILFTLVYLIIQAVL